MKHTPMMPPQPAIQLLIIAASTFGPPAERCAWLHGFCLLTLRPDGSPVLTRAKVATGERYCDDGPLISELTRLLDTSAILAGPDLTGMLSKLGRLAIDATDQRPALELLDKLETMIEVNPPIDLALFAETRGHVARHAREQQLGIAEDIGDDGGDALFKGMDNGNPAALSLMMAETADACALALAEMKGGEPQVAALRNERLKWREKLLSRLSRIGD